MAITLTVNGETRSVDVEPDTPLLWALRDTLGLTGTKFGCGISACGACTVHLNGRAVRSCTFPISAAEGAAITTIEGLAQDGTLHKVQEAWVAHQVPTVWLLSVRDDHGRLGASRAAPESKRRADRRDDHEHLSLRNLCARAPRDP